MIVIIIIIIIIIILVMVSRLVLTSLLRHKTVVCAVCQTRQNVSNDKGACNRRDVNPLSTNVSF